MNFHTTKESKRRQTNVEIEVTQYEQLYFESNTANLLSLPGFYQETLLVLEKILGICGPFPLVLEMFYI